MSDPEGGILWARLTGGLGVSQGDPEDLTGTEDWEDIDEESLSGQSDTDPMEEEDPGPAERERRIKKGREARAALRERERGLKASQAPVSYTHLTLPTIYTV